MIGFKSLKISCIKNSDSCLRLLVLQSILRGLSFNYYFVKYQGNNAGIDTSIIKNSLRVYTFIENNPLCKFVGIPINNKRIGFPNVPTNSIDSSSQFKVGIFLNS